MAWVRIHDGAMMNEKIVNLPDSAFRLWVRGLCYCQTALTDGLIPHRALKEMGARRADVARLVAPQVADRAPLWEEHVMGFKVHDYLEWNDCRDKVKKRQADADDRKRIYNDKKDAARVQNASENASRTRPPLNAEPNQTKPNQTFLRKKEPQRPSSRSKRPIFTGQRLTVHEWMLDELMKMLGTHTDEFGIDEWFFEADGKAMAMAVVSDDWWPWLKAETKAEAQRRGLPIALAPMLTSGKQTSRLAAALANIKAEAV